MIDPDWPKTITFRIEDVPELPDVPDFDPEAKREARRQRIEENRRWLEEHMGFRPFGAEL